MARIKNPNRKRERVCCECGKVESVHKDNPAMRCLSCAAKARGLVGLASIKRKANAAMTFCPVCGGKKHKSDTYCSVACRLTVVRVDRVCKCCGVSFRVPRSRVDGKSNASANFCSRPCYEKFLCRTGRVTGRGSQWLKIRTRVKTKSPFCACCGTVRKQLQVHHIVPFRLTFDNGDANLIPLCLKCHKSIEHTTQEAEAIGASPEEIGDVFQFVLRSRQEATRHLLRRLINEC